ncbi:ninein-like protein isoform X2 [Salmo salar]|uniref:Ninein-like protein isoform X2 n=1 Tax=Salmo salar TaxID=8030 RepID=A0A1S3N3B9_SALSA|nr:ninein-like protein isoform X2 [Salmo salar]|eukprot:XP_014009526.1 PREDICTED: ninein-like protein isoform X3 [Salmo salar]
MDEEEQNRYVAQLKEEFDSCDTTGTGYLDKEELSSLCHKLSLDAHLPVLLDTLLGPHHYARVNFEEFKEGFVAVLSRSLDFSTSEEESSYLEPVVPEEVKPKFVKGTKRYGRRSHPDRPDSELPAELEDSPPFRTEQKELSPAGVRRAKLRRSTSLESVESLKSDEETGSQKDTIHQTFEAQGQQKRWKRDSSGSPLQSPGPRPEVSDSQMRAVWEELGVGGGGFLNRQELSLVCDHLGLQDLNSEELDALFRKLDTDLDGRVSLRKFQKGLFREKGVPVPTSSTPIRHNPHRSLQQAFEERIVRSTSPSLLSATVGQRLLTRLDDGSGCTSPERVITLWNEEGIKNSRDILQTLDFPLEERVSLAELTLALDNELLVSGNGIHQAALISYKNEIQFLQVLADQACQERDKVKADLEWADKRNLQLVREVDDRHTTIESLNETKIKGLEQEFRDRLAALRSESEQESEVLLQQVERERAKLKEEVEVLHAQDASLQEEICNATQENRCLEEEGSVLKGKLSEAENTISKLQRDLDQLLLDKFGSLDPNNTGLLNQEERFSEIIKEYELQCRELRDRNDELNSEVEMLKSQGMGRRPRRARDTSTHAWSSRRSLTTESDSDDPEMKIGESPMASKKLQVANKNGLGCLESLPGPVVSIETEMAMEQFKERHSQEVQDLKIELETKVNFYERSLELMRRNMEVERKDISSGFKVEISELEEQKAQAEEQVKRLREAVEKLQAELQSSSRSLRGPGWGADQERRAQREQAELEQNYAREISNLVQRLTSEKDQLEAELKLKMDQDLLIVSSQLDEVNCENSALKDRLAMLQQDVQRMEEEIIKKKKKLDEVEQEHEKNREKQERLHKENAKYQEEVLDLRARNLQLSGENAELSSRLRADQGAVQMLTERLAQVSREQEEGVATARQLQETSTQQERERLHLEKELHTVKEKLQCLSEVESSLTSLTLKHQWLEQDKERLLREVEERTQKVEKLQESLLSVGSQMELLRSQLQAVDQEKTGQTQEVANQQRMIQDAQDKVKELEASMGRLSREKEQLRLAQKQHEDNTMALQKECQSLRLQNQELLHRLQGQDVEVQRLTEECLTLKNKQTQLDTARAEAQDQALMVDTALTLAQAQHVRELQQLREQAGLESREQLAHFQAQLADEKCRGQKLQQTLRTQAQQASTQIGLQQEQYEKVIGNMQERMEGVETKLRSVRKMLQEKVNQLKEQLAKNAKSDIMLKDLYVENSQLMKALQVTEQRQKSAEKNNFVLEEKITALNKLLRKIAPASLSA